MTEKVYQSALILVDFKFTESEQSELLAAANVSFSSGTILKFELSIGAYLASTLHFHHGARPKDVFKVLEATGKHLSNLEDIFGQFLGIDGIDALIIGSINGLELGDLTDDEQIAQGIQYEISDSSSDGTNDLYRATANLLNFELEQHQEDKTDVNDIIDVAYIYDIIKLTSYCVERSIERIRSAGGRIGDPFLTTLIVALWNSFKCDTDLGKYSCPFIDFIHAVRVIISKRLLKMGEKIAAQTVMQADRENLKSRVRDAFRETKNRDGFPQ